MPRHSESEFAGFVVGALSVGFVMSLIIMFTQISSPVPEEIEELEYRNEELTRCVEDLQEHLLEIRSWLGQSDTDYQSLYSTVFDVESYINLSPGNCD